MIYSKSVIRFALSALLGSVALASSVFLLSYLEVDAEYPQLSEIASRHKPLNELGVQSIEVVFHANAAPYSFELCSDGCLGHYQINSQRVNPAFADGRIQGEENRYVDDYFYFEAKRSSSGSWVVTAKDDLKLKHTPERAQAVFSEMLDKLTARYASDKALLSSWEQPK